MNSDRSQWQSLASRIFKIKTKKQQLPYHETVISFHFDNVLDTTIMYLNTLNINVFDQGKIVIKKRGWGK